MLSPPSLMLRHPSSPWTISCDEIRSKLQTVSPGIHISCIYSIYIIYIKKRSYILAKSRSVNFILYIYCLYIYIYTQSCPFRFKDDDIHERAWYPFPIIGGLPLHGQFNRLLAIGSNHEEKRPTSKPKNTESCPRFL